jgi:hypothetical protein
LKLIINTYGAPPWPPGVLDLFASAVVGSEHGRLPRRQYPDAFSSFGAAAIAEVKNAHVVVVMTTIDFSVQEITSDEQWSVLTTNLQRLLPK